MKQFFALLFLTFLVMALAENENPTNNQEKNSNLPIDQSGEDISKPQQRFFGFGKFYSFI